MNALRANSRTYHVLLIRFTATALGASALLPVPVRSQICYNEHVPAGSVPDGMRCNFTVNSFFPGVKPMNKFHELFRAARGAFTLFTIVTAGALATLAAPVFAQSPGEICYYEKVANAYVPDGMGGYKVSYNMVLTCAVDPVKDAAAKQAAIEATQIRRETDRIIGGRSHAADPDTDAAMAMSEFNRQLAELEKELADPITPSGTMTFEKEVFRLPELSIPFAAVVRYRSDAGYIGSLGYGWDLSHNKRLYVVHKCPFYLTSVTWPEDNASDCIIEYHDGAFGVVRFRHAGQSFIKDANNEWIRVQNFIPVENYTSTKSPGIGLSLTHKGNEFILRDGTSLRYVFAGENFDKDTDRFDDQNQGRGPWRPLTAIRDELGNETRLEWAANYDGFQYPRILKITDQVGREIKFDYLYENAPLPPVARANYFLRGLFFENQWVVEFSYNLDPNSPHWGELIKITDLNQNFTRFVYDTPPVPVDPVPGVAVAKRLSFPNTEALCRKATDSSLYPGGCDPMVATCAKLANRAIWGFNECVDSHCNECVPPAWCSRVAEQDCPAFCWKWRREWVDASYVEYPFCKGVQLDDVQYRQCIDHYLPTDANGDSWYMFGEDSALAHNLTEIYDGLNRRVLQNVYGKDPHRIDYDRVTQQNFGEEFGYNQSATASITYHDLVHEDEWARNGFLTVGNKILRHPTSVADPQHVEDLEHFNSVEICPVTPGNDGPRLSDQHVIHSGRAREPQLPVLAAVVRDLHDEIRTIYLNQAGQVLRVTRFDGRQAPETRNFNWIAEGAETPAMVADLFTAPKLVGGTHTGLELPDGRRICTRKTGLDQPALKVIFLAPGHLGSQTPRRAVYDYDADHRLVYTSQGEDPNNPNLPKQWTRIERRDSAGRVTLMETGGTGLAQPVRTEFTYFGQNLIISPRVVGMGGSVSQSVLSPWGGAPEVVQSSGFDGALPVAQIFNYDHDFGRLLGKRLVIGTTAAQQTGYEYDAAGRLKVITHKKDPEDSGWTTELDYNGADQLVSVKQPDHARYIDVDVFGHPKAITDTPLNGYVGQLQERLFNYDPYGRLLSELSAERELHCYQYDGLGRLTSERVGKLPPNDPFVGACDDATIAYESAFSRHYALGGFLDSEFRDGTTVRYVANGFGETIIAMNSRSVEQWIGYDSFGRPSWAATYEPAPNRPAYGDPRSVVGINTGLLAAAWVTYDALDRPISEVVLHIDEDGKQVGFRPELTTTTTYDDVNRLVTTTGPSGEIVTTEYDTGGRMVKQTMPNQAEITQRWLQNNTMSRSLPTTAGVMTRTHFFDGMGLPVREEDAQMGEMWKVERDHYGRVFHSTTRSGADILMTYDAHGNVIDTVQDAAPNQPIKLRFFYDRDNRLKESHNAIGGRTHRFYDDQGRLNRKLDPNNWATQISYVPGTGLVDTLTRPGGTWIKNVYATGRLEHQDIHHGPDADPLYANGVTTRSFTYTGLGQLRTAKITGTMDFPTKGLTNTFHYDSLGNTLAEANSLLQLLKITRLPDPSLRTVTTQVGQAKIEQTADLMGRLSSFKLNGNNLATFQYANNVVGGPIGIHYANGTNTDFVYDTLGRQTQLHVFGSPDAQGHPKPILAMAWAYGSDDTPRHRRFALGNGPNRSEFFQVDNASRLTAEGLRNIDVFPNLPAEPSNADVQQYLQPGGSAFVKQYTLDESANWTGVNVFSQGGHWLPRTYTPGPANQYNFFNQHSVRYDAAGGLTAFPAADPIDIYKYDGEGTLSVASSDGGVTGKRFFNDALGRRTVETDLSGLNPVYKLWDGDAIRAFGTDPAKLDSFTLRVSGKGVDRHLALVDQGGLGSPFVYPHQDPLGSTYALSDKEGNFVEGYDYSAFGDTTFYGSNGTDRIGGSAHGNPFLFQGQHYDESLKLYFFKAREYKPGWGRFLTRDPLGETYTMSGLHGDAYAMGDTRISGANPFAFADGSPLAATDPTGTTTRRLNQAQEITKYVPHDFGQLPPYTPLNLGPILTNPAPPIDMISLPSTLGYTNNEIVNQAGLALNTYAESILNLPGDFMNHFLLTPSRTFNNVSRADYAFQQGDYVEGVIQANAAKDEVIGFVVNSVTGFESAAGLLEGALTRGVFYGEAPMGGTVGGRHLPLASPEILDALQVAERAGQVLPGMGSVGIGIDHRLASRGYAELNTRMDISTLSMRKINDYSNPAAAALLDANPTIEIYSFGLDASKLPLCQSNVNWRYGTYTEAEIYTATSNAIVSGSANIYVWSESASGALVRQPFPAAVIKFLSHPWWLPK